MEIQYKNLQVGHGAEPFVSEGRYYVARFFGQTYMYLPSEERLRVKPQRVVEIFSEERFVSLRGSHTELWVSKNHMFLDFGPVYFPENRSSLLRDHSEAEVKAMFERDPALVYPAYYLPDTFAEAVYAESPLAFVRH